MYQKILVGFDGSEGSRMALAQALHLGKQLGAEVWALWVRGALPHYPETVDEVEQERSASDSFRQKLAREADRIAKELGHEVHSVNRVGHPAKVITEFAEEGGFDVIVLGNRGHSGLWGRFLGHTTDRVSETASCSVLIVR